MKRAKLIVTLQDDVILSEHAASVGHRGLDYLPGSVFLGIAAAHLYSTLPAQKSWVLFHSGQVQFGSAYPSILPTNTVSCPIPLSWSYEKGEDYYKTIDNTRWLKSDALYHKAKQNSEPTNETKKPPEKLQAVHEAFIDPKTGQILTAKRKSLLKTAIDGKYGGAAESQLFAYQGLETGQTFIGFVHADDTLSDDFKTLISALSGQHRIGRSRSAEFGRIHIEVQSDQETLPNTTDVADVIDDHCLQLWCLSDLAVLNAQGIPTLTPTPEELGLPKGHLCLEKSTIRSRSYTPYNQARGCYDLERTVITKGSVLTFKLANNQVNANQIALQSVAGVGLYREQGLGQIWVNPKLLDSVKPNFPDSDRQHAQKNHTQQKPEANAKFKKIKQPDHPLIAWLQAQHNNQNQHQFIEQKALKLRDLTQSFYRSAQALAGTQERIGPSKSQWGRVMETAKQGTIPLKQALFDTDTGICKTTLSEQAPDWGAEGVFQANIITFRSFMEHQLKTLELDNTTSEDAVRHIVSQWAHKTLTWLGQAETPSLKELAS